MVRGIHPYASVGSLLTHLLELLVIWLLVWDESLGTMAQRGPKDAEDDTQEAQAACLQ